MRALCEPHGLHPVVFLKKQDNTVLLEVIDTRMTYREEFDAGKLNWLRDAIDKCLDKSDNSVGRWELIQN